jgi:hypothetical protein
MRPSQSELSEPERRLNELIAGYLEAAESGQAPTGSSCWPATPTWPTACAPSSPTMTARPRTSASPATWAAPSTARNSPAMRPASATPVRAVQHGGLLPAEVDRPLRVTA